MCHGLAYANTQVRSIKIEASQLLFLMHEKTDELRQLITLWGQPRGDSAGGDSAPGSPSRGASREKTTVQSIGLIDDETKLAISQAAGNVVKQLRLLKGWLKGEDGSRTALEIFQAWDPNGSYEISQGEFRKALEAHGFEAPRSLTQALFDELDSDSTYKLDYREMQAWLSSDD